MGEVLRRLMRLICDFDSLCVGITLLFGDEKCISTSELDVRLCAFVIKNAAGAYTSLYPIVAAFYVSESRVECA